jgi:hypothetical protein
MSAKRRRRRRRRRRSHRRCFWTVPQKTNLCHMTVTVKVMVTVTKTSHNKTTQSGEKIQSGHGAPVIHRFTGGPRGIRHNAAPTINKDSTPLLSVFMLSFLEIIQLLVVETNRYYHQYLDSLNDRPHCLT